MEDKSGEKRNLKDRIKELVKKSLRIAALVIAGLSVFLYFFQSIYMYRPLPDIILTPDKVGLDYEDVTFTSEDGVRLHGWFFAPKKDPVVILFCHSNAGNISYYLETISILTDLGRGVFIFDYRGFGLSEGKPDEEGTYKDAKAAWKYLTRERGLDESLIVVHGRSLGGAAAAYLAAHKNPRALIVESSFSSFPEVARDYYPYLPVGLIARYQYPTAEYVSRSACPKLIMHGRDDEVVPFYHGEKIFKAAKPPKRFVELKGDHNDGFSLSGDVYKNSISEFLDSLSPSKARIRNE